MKLGFASCAAVVATLALGAPAWAAKTTICHDATGNPHTISVNDDALQAHLDHGDALGTCAGVACPCYNEEDVQLITEENNGGYDFNSCTLSTLKTSSAKHDFLSIATGIIDNSYQIRFTVATNKPFHCFRFVPDDSNLLFGLTREETEVCELLIRDRCDELGTPVVTVP